MEREELEAKLNELKSDYTRIQGDLDKLEYIKGKTNSNERQLAKLEDEIAEVNRKLDELP